MATFFYFKKNIPGYPHFLVLFFKIIFEGGFIHVSAV